MKWSRVPTGEPMWNVNTGVIMQELFKLIISATILQCNCNEVVFDKTELLKTSVPAILYYIQNLLNYVSNNYLDAATFAVVNQTKIVIVAILSTMLLKKSFDLRQWVSLFILTVGACMVVLSQMSSSGGAKDTIFTGISILLPGICCGCLGGVYFEKILKGSVVDLWVRNVQLAFYSCIFGLITLYTTSYDDIAENGFFHGYNASVWMSIAINGGGGLLVALVLKYADNVLKNFAIALALILTGISSVYFFGTVLNFMFAVGVWVVISSLLLYQNLLSSCLPKAIVNSTELQSMVKQPSQN